ncbi:C40 family peptidase [Streptomyces sp. P01-B04]|uniref:C40 family peptidase n=1 Tax=Streptomyces poriferorum TaxID=2798799 RepID=UPI001C5CC901|nr:C40 family peptidase [Streptomyces poriferorum]MBW5252050.1 C40 family peptidase [Streptomyces poriferorum]MBW5260220.1 C40 family peptidase [Streptomyces poriferorum]
MAQQGGISGVAVGMATAGAFLLYVGIQGVDIRAGLKDITNGKLPEGKPKSSGATAAAEAALAQGSAAGASRPSSGTGAGAGPHPELVTAARRYLGVPYVFGGTTPKGLDCSGLVVLAFRDAYGVTPPRTTYVQVAWRQLTKISRADMGAGDLCFWPASGPPSHVAIAVDGDTVIHAPRPGKVVQEVPVGQAFTGGALPVVYRYTGGK